MQAVLYAKFVRTRILLVLAVISFLSGIISRGGV